MSYSGANGNRPFELAGKSNQRHIINDPDVKSYLETCDLPPNLDSVSLDEQLIFGLQDVDTADVKSIIAIDGGFSTVAVKDGYPSSQITFFQFGALFFEMSDLEEVESSPFIDPKDMAKLKEIQRLKLVFPTKNIGKPGLRDFKTVARKSVYDFFVNENNGFELAKTLRWTIFEEFIRPLQSYQLSRCPECEATKVELLRDQMSPDYKFKCPECNGEIYITDVFRFHEIIDNEIGSGGVLGYLIRAVEHMFLLDIIRTLIIKKSSILKNILFIMDGPLALFGQTAKLHGPIRKILDQAIQKYDLKLIGIEKSGAFVDHAIGIKDKLTNNTVFVPNNNYIYKYIVTGESRENKPYGDTTYYSAKVIFKSQGGGIFVVTVPVDSKKYVTYPEEHKLKNIHLILNTLQRLKSDMYDNAIFPIALTNKLVSLAYHPSSKILERFARGSVQHQES